MCVGREGEKPPIEQDELGASMIVTTQPSEMPSLQYQALAAAVKAGMMPANTQYLYWPVGVTVWLPVMLSWVCTRVGWLKNRNNATQE